MAALSSTAAAATSKRPISHLPPPARSSLEVLKRPPPRFEEGSQTAVTMLI